jgi:hypothetical protein
VKAFAGRGLRAPGGRSGKHQRERDGHDMFQAAPPSVPAVSPIRVNFNPTCHHLPSFLREEGPSRRF